MIDFTRMYSSMNEKTPEKVLSNRYKSPRGFLVLYRIGYKIFRSNKNIVYIKGQGPRAGHFWYFYLQPVLRYIRVKNIKH